ncbi:MAG: TonB-dependent receptor [Gammaproteobacteria bacterium]|nr:TonB-dependent receptor [Gammaproteobacteria bacterium]
MRSDTSRSLRVRTRLVAVGALSAALLGGSMEAAFGAALEEVVVTATRREASLQDIGISVTAFSADELRQLNVVRTDDIATQTPGLRFTMAGGAPLVGLVSIRGVAQNDFAAHLEAANVLYIDDVYRPSIGSNLQNFFDTERVEVLKGPQGTLFGRNATGGLIHIITREPTEAFEGYIDTTVGEYDEVVVEGAVSGSLASGVTARVAFMHSEHDGWIENSAGPDSVADDTNAVRGKLVFEPNEQLRIKLQAEWHDTDPVDAGGGFATGGFVGADTLGQFRPPPAPTDAGYVDADGSPFTGAFDYPGQYEREELTLFGDIEYTYGNLVFTSLTAYTDHEALYDEDNDLTPFDIAIFRQNTTQESFSQELRVNADYDRMRLTGGLYYLNIDGDYFQNYQINNLAGGGVSQIAPGAPPFFIPLGLNQFADYSLETSSWSVFGQGEYDLTAALTVTAGLRYTRDEKDYSYLNVCQELGPIPACLAPPPPEPTLASAGLVTDNHDEGGVSARVQFDYRVNEDLLVFASYNRGYKAFNYNAGFAGAATVAGVRFDGETLNAFEIGTKTDFWGGLARFNASVFYYIYEDYQAFDQRGTQFILTNTEATIYGADAELRVSPGYGLNFLFGLALLDTQVDDIPIAGQLLEREAPQSPDLTFNYAASKDFPIAAGIVRVGLDGAYTGGYFSQLTNAPVTRVDSNWLLNGRLAFLSADEHWELSVFARNMLDEERLIYAFDITYPGNGLVEQAFAPPRWVGGQLRFKF